MEKKNNGLLVFLVVIMFLIIIGLCLFIAYDKEIIFNNDKEATENKDNNDDVNKNEETEITSVILQRELEKDVNIVRLAVEEFNSNGYIYKIYDYDILTLADLNDVDRKTAAIWNEHWTNDVTYGIKLLNTSVVQKQYNSLFGPGNISLKDNDECGGYTYNAVSNIFKDLEVGCGGTSAVYTLSYINRYTQDVAQAHVYVSVGLRDFDNSHDNLATFTGYDKKKKYTGQEITINANNYKEFSEYKYTFDINEDGTYRFNKMEKIK